MKSLFTILFSIVALFASAQTPFSLMSLEKNVSASKSAISLKNPYLGAELLYNIKGEVEQNFDLNAHVFYNAVTWDKGALPIMTNVTLTPDSLSTENGVTFGMYPYQSLIFMDKLQLLAHSGIAYHFKNLQNSEYNEFRFLIGLEAAIYGDSGNPITLSVAPEFSLATGIDEWRSQLSITGILPLVNNLGIIFDGSIPFDNSNSSFSIGVLFNSQSR